MIDSLTKIKSFHAFLEHILTCKSPKLFLVDIKEFKKINLEHSDEGGNFVLRALADALSNFAKNYEMEIFRAKNDQFILLLNTPFELTKMEKIIFALCDFVKMQTYNYQEKVIAIDMHIGICFDHTNPLMKAQKALQVAKAENQLFVTYSEFANTLMNESEEKIEMMVKEAIEDEHIVLHFQSIVDRKNTIVYYESLIRLDSHQGLQSPKLFLKIAREKNFYDLLLENIAKKVTALSQTKALKIALNLSSFDLLDEKRVKVLCNLFAHQNVIFEIQCEEKEHLLKILALIELFKKEGIFIALDNVESADVLEIFPKNSIDFVKIHGDIIRNLSIEPSLLFTCKDILAMAKSRGIKTIATHINSKASLEAAQNLDFDLFQGYIFEQPHTL